MVLESALEEKLKQQMGLSPEEFTLFRCYAQFRQYSPGEVIIEEGSSGNEIYYLAQGQVDIIKDLCGKPKYWGTTKEGNFFGEAGLFEGSQSTRSASVKAKVQSLVFCFNKEDFSGMMGGGLPEKLCSKLLAGMMLKLREKSFQAADLYLQFKKNKPQ